jgi:hypothetical protein
MPTNKHPSQIIQGIGFGELIGYNQYNAKHYLDSDGCRFGGTDKSYGIPGGKQV